MALYSSVGLAGPVALEGEIGVVAITLLSQEEMILALGKARIEAKGNGLVGVNIMAADKHVEERLENALLTKMVDVVIQGAGVTKAVPRICNKYGVSYFPIISRPAQVDFYSSHFDISGFVYEGAEAGGHIGNLEKTLFRKGDTTLEEIVDRAKEIPVYAAGGITPERVGEVLARGAYGIQIATPCLLAVECALPVEVKEFYAKSGPEDLVLIDSPAGMPGRALQNALTEGLANRLWFSPKFFGLKKCTKCLKACKSRESEHMQSFCIRGSLIFARDGNLDYGLFFSGKEIGYWNEFTTVKNIINLYRERINEFIKTRSASL